MIFEFNTDTIYDTVGNLIQASKQCRRLIRPQGTRIRIYFKLHDYDGNFVNEYSSSVRGWTKCIAKDMSLIKRGSIESIFYPYPII